MFVSNTSNNQGVSRQLNIWHSKKTGCDFAQPEHPHSHNFLTE
jgi:hypothetical protein